jgi:uncharacterized membrane protein YagU involved in acid resistance
MNTTIAPRHILWITALAGLVAGALDISFAFIFYGLLGASPAGILRGIAGGVLGPGANTMGGWSAVVLGAVLHFSICVCAAFVYLRMSRSLPLLIRQPVLSGAAFGVAMYIFMHFVVIPLSRFPFHLPSTRSLIGELFSHIVFFGMVIAVSVARATRGDGSANQARSWTPHVPR